MKPVKFTVAFLIYCLCIFACKREAPTKKECFDTAPTERTITDKLATIKETGNKYYIIEQNTIDTKLLPCNLDASFKVDNLQVIVSGEVKQTTPIAGHPCCTSNFLITSIRR